MLDTLATPTPIFDDLVRELGLDPTAGIQAADRGADAEAIPQGPLSAPPAVDPAQALPAGDALTGG